MKHRKNCAETCSEKILWRVKVSWPSKHCVFCQSTMMSEVSLPEIKKVKLLYCSIDCMGTVEDATGRHTDCCGGVLAMEHVSSIAELMSAILCKWAREYGRSFKWYRCKHALDFEGKIKNIPISALLYKQICLLHSRKNTYLQ